VEGRSGNNYVLRIVSELKNSDCDARGDSLPFNYRLFLAPKQNLGSRTF